MKLVVTSRPIMPTEEKLFYVVDATPHAGYECRFKGTVKQCIQWQQDNSRGEIPLYCQIKVCEELITSIQSATMIDAIIIWESK